MPKVSVIIPVYNTEKYLRECLDSVINQTLSDIEIICVDDGSTDLSSEILKEYAEKDGRIKVYTQQNKGAGAARNFGLKKASGEFVAFMDADDKYPDKQTLETVFIKVKENNVLICGGEFAVFTECQKKPFQDEIEWISKGASLDGYFFPEEKIINYKDYQFDYGYHRFIYNKNFLIENNLFFPDYKRYQDPPFLVKAMFNAENFYAISKITYAYRINHNEVKWDVIKINDMLSGILDNMIFAFDNSLEKLNEYSFIRLKQHYPMIKNVINFKSLLIINKMTKYNKRIKKFNREYKLTIMQHYISLFLKNIFSIKNDTRKTHKIITLFGLKLKIKRKGR